MKFSENSFIKINRYFIWGKVCIVCNTSAISSEEMSWELMCGFSPKRKNIWISVSVGYHAVQIRLSALCWALESYAVLCIRWLPGALAMSYWRAPLPLSYICVHKSQCFFQSSNLCIQIRIFFCHKKNQIIKTWRIPFPSVPSILTRNLFEQKSKLNFSFCLLNIICEKPLKTNFHFHWNFHFFLVM